MLHVLTVPPTLTGTHCKKTQFVHFQLCKDEANPIQHTGIGQFKNCWWVDFATRLAVSSCFRSSCLTKALHACPKRSTPSDNHANTYWLHLMPLDECCSWAACSGMANLTDTVARLETLAHISRKQLTEMCLLVSHAVEESEVFIITWQWLVSGWPWFAWSS